MRLISFLFATLLLSSAIPSFAMDKEMAPDPMQDLPLEGEALTEIFMDTTHRGYYEVGDWDRTDPAFTEVMNADGSTVHDRDGVRSLGRWQTRSNVVCFTYDNLGGGCFNIYQRGNCYYAFSANYKELVAISVLDGETPDCEPSFA